MIRSGRHTAMELLSPKRVWLSKRRCLVEWEKPPMQKRQNFVQSLRIHRSWVIFCALPLDFWIGLFDILWGSTRGMRQLRRGCEPSMLMHVGGYGLVVSYGFFHIFPSTFRCLKCWIWAMRMIVMRLLGCTVISSYSNTHEFFLGLQPVHLRLRQKVCGVADYGPLLYIGFFQLKRSEIRSARQAIRNDIEIWSTSSWHVVFCGSLREKHGKTVIIPADVTWSWYREWSRILNSLQSNMACWKMDYLEFRGDVPWFSLLAPPYLWVILQPARFDLIIFFRTIDA